jgi:hypothetical protein
MVKREDLTRGTLVQISSNLKYSREKSWTNNEVMNGDVKYATIIKFHDTVTEAIQIMYTRINRTEHTHIHYKDLSIIDKIPTLKKEIVLFDEHNLDI